jgi:hypothetical protein
MSSMRRYYPEAAMRRGKRIETRSSALEEIRNEEA